MMIRRSSVVTPKTRIPLWGGGGGGGGGGGVSITTTYQFQQSRKVSAVAAMNLRQIFCKRFVFVFLDHF